MADICRVIMTGRLTRDAQLKYTSGGIPVVRFSIAVNKRRKVNGQWTEVGHFFDCIYWGAPAEAVSRYLVKGKDVTIDGEPNQNRWEQDGEHRSKVEFQVENLKLGNTPHGGQGQGERQGAEGPPEPESYPDGSYPYPQDVNEDIPF